MRILIILVLLRSLCLAQVALANTERKLPADLQFDLIFPRNETYAPTQFFPIVLGIQNLDAVWPIEISIRATVGPRNETPRSSWPAWEHVIGGLSYEDVAKLSGPAPGHHLIHNFAINMTNATAGQFFVAWDVRLWWQCHNGTDDNRVTAERFVSTGVVDFSTEHRAQVPDVEATINTCPEPNNTTSTVMRITDVVRAPSDGSWCPVLDNVTETTPVKCGYKDIANEISTNNPSMSSCGDWKVDHSFCIKSPAGLPTSSTTTTVTTTTRTSTTTAPPQPTPTTTRPPNGIETPQPVQPGMVDNCNRFHLVAAGESCWVLSNKYGVTSAQLNTWNPLIGGEACNNMWTGYYVCVGVPGSSPGPTSTTTTPGPSNPTPTPTQDGMVGNCNRFHLVQAGENCAVLATRYGLTVAQLAQWNAGIGGVECRNMWTGYYVCIGVVGTTPQPPPPNPTPQPTQEGMVAGCKKFHFVQSGQNCDVISRLLGVSVANIIRWNPAVGPSCANLWAGTYACVGL
ncbi:hypothetical protein PspLS_09442 [Pyricularia sp. CBS 133598]|nr:hypothetical protein PspLS_09442 [Pyricularia sp. CBS 133598]